MLALEVYRELSSLRALERPHMMLGVNVIAADTDDEARLLFTSLQQAFVKQRAPRRGPLPPPPME